MTIATTLLTARTISDAELARANSLETQVGTLSATVDAQAVEIARLKALVAPPPPPVVVPPPAPMRTGLYVDGSKFRTRFGAELRLRVVEVMVNGNCAGYGYSKFLAQIKADLGANAVSPLFQGTYGATAEVKKFCDAALALGMVVGVNADHQGDTQGWSTKPDLVALLNSYPHVYIVCDVETYTNGDESTAAWATAEKAKIAKFRAAGLTCPIKAGAHGGGRDVKYPLAKGAEVLASDPLRNVLFTWQAYWKAATGGWQYSTSNGAFAEGVAGTKQALAACAVSGLCFIPGFDVKDNVGLTGIEELIDQANSLGLSHAHWAATGDGSNPENNCYDWDFKPASPPKPAAALLAAKWLPARGAFPDAPL